MHHFHTHRISDEFAIDADSGVITVVGDLDEENIAMYTLTVQAENHRATGVTPTTVRTNKTNSALKNRWQYTRGSIRDNRAVCTQKKLIILLLLAD